MPALAEIRLAADNLMHFGLAGAGDNLCITQSPHLSKPETAILLTALAAKHALHSRGAEVALIDLDDAFKR